MVGIDSPSRHLLSPDASVDCSLAMLNVVSRGATGPLGSDDFAVEVESKHMAASANRAEFGDTSDTVLLEFERIRETVETVSEVENLLESRENTGYYA